LSEPPSDPRGSGEATLWAEQAVSLAEAVEIYTIRGARALRLDDRFGSIEPGKLGNLIILEENIFEIPVEQVSETTIRQTYFEGQLVYQRH
jgi:hypothetical protein